MLSLSPFLNVHMATVRTTFCCKHKIHVLEMSFPLFSDKIWVLYLEITKDRIAWIKESKFSCSRMYGKTEWISYRNIYPERVTASIFGWDHSKYSKRSAEPYQRVGTMDSPDVMATRTSFLPLQLQVLLAAQGLEASFLIHVKAILVCLV